MLLRLSFLATAFGPSLLLCTRLRAVNSSADRSQIRRIFNPFLPQRPRRRCTEYRVPRVRMHIHIAYVYMASLERRLNGLAGSRKLRHCTSNDWR